MRERRVPATVRIGGNSIEIEISTSTVPGALSALTLLLEQRASAVVVLAPSSARRAMTLEVVHAPLEDEWSSITTGPRGRLVWRIVRRDLEVLLGHLFDYHRPDRIPVDHVDFEAFDSGTDGVTVDLAVRVVNP